MAEEIKLNDETDNGKGIKLDELITEKNTNEHCSVSVPVTPIIKEEDSNDAHENEASFGFESAFDTEKECFHERMKPENIEKSSEDEDLLGFSSVITPLMLKEEEANKESSLSVNADCNANVEDKKNDQNGQEIEKLIEPPMKRIKVDDSDSKETTEEKEASECVAVATTSSPETACSVPRSIHPSTSGEPAPMVEAEELLVEEEEEELLEEENHDEEELLEEEEEEEDLLGAAVDDEEAVISRVINRSNFDENEKRQAEDRKLMALLAHFSEDQLNCFETFRRATFPKATVKRLMSSVSSCSICQNVVIAMAGMTKVFIGELLDIAFECRDTQAAASTSTQISMAKPNLQPKHIRTALRTLQLRNKTSHPLRPNMLL